MIVLETFKTHMKIQCRHVWRHKNLTVEIFMEIFGDRNFTMKIFMETHLKILMKIFVRGIEDMEENYYFY